MGRNNHVAHQLVGVKKYVAVDSLIQALYSDISCINNNICFSLSVNTANNQRCLRHCIATMEYNTSTIC